MTSPNTTATTRACAACGETGTGRFCAGCGASLDGATCAGCGATLSPGAKFCHGCGLPAGAAASLAGPRMAGTAAGTAVGASGMTSIMPWAVAFVAMLALAAMAAGRNFNVRKGSAIDGSANALPQSALGEAPPAMPPGAGGAPFAGGAGGAASGGRPPNLANMSPREIADRLFDRVMLMSSQGKPDSAAFFASMAIQNYESMGPLDLDLRYDMGRVAEVAGRADVATAQADSILAANPTHLLGLVLATKAAALRNDRTALTTFQQRLLAADRSGERGRGIEEYTRHSADIDAAVAAAKGNGRT